MKKFIIVLIAICAWQILFSQSIQLDGLTRSGFKGIDRLGDDGYYIRYVETLREGKKFKTQVRVYILDNNLVKTNDFVVPIGQEEKIEDMAFNNDRFMFISSSSTERTRQFIIVDSKGTEIASKKFEKVKMRLLYTPASVIAFEESDFLVINYIKEKKVGYNISRYNDNLEEVFSADQIPEKRRLYPVDYYVGDKLYILEFITPDFSDYFEYHVAGFDLSTGEEAFKVRLKDPSSEASGFATFLKQGSNGPITGGMYFNGNRTKKANSDGFFATVIDKDGSANFSFTDWKEVKSELKDENMAAFWGGKTKTFMQDVVVYDDGAFTLIGENYRRGDADLAGDRNKSVLANAGKAYKLYQNEGGEDYNQAVTVSSFALMDFDAKGKYIGIRRLPKPTSVTVIKATDDENDKPYIGQAKGLNLANILNNQGYFPYRFTVSNGPDKFIVSVVKYESMSKELLYFTKLNTDVVDTASVEFTNSYLKVVQEMQNKVVGKFGALGKLAKKADNLTGESKKNEFFLRGSHSPYDYRAKALNTRVIKSNQEGKIITYDFVPEEPEENKKKKGFMGNLLEAMKGNLVIQSIAIPDK
ncbi:MAG: hypothetical protein GDA37_02715 [Ekhidna sp.]|nr:hypothetical protein [Ekhidna sp.]